MKLKMFLGLAIVFFLNTAMGCKEDDAIWKFFSMDIKNINNEGELPLISNDSIRKEAYALDILYMGKDVDSGMDYNRIDFVNCTDTIVEQIIFTNNDFDNEYAAGSNITEFFKPIYGSFNGGSDKKKWHGGTYILTRVPNPGIHSFKVCVYRSNGTFVEKNTTPVKLY